MKPIFQIPNIDLDTLSDEKAIEWLEIFSVVKKECEKHEKRIKLVLIERNNNQLQALLQAKDEPYGGVKVKLNDGKHVLEYTVPKKVDWDQDKLKIAQDEIKSWDEDPDDYIEVKLNVAESKYKAWPPMLKKTFKDARTVSSGTPSVKILEAKE